MTSSVSFTRENLKFEKTIVLPTPIRSNIFGVPLEELMGYHGEKGGLPRVVKDSIQYLLTNGVWSPYYSIFSCTNIHDRSIGGGHIQAVTASSDAQSSSRRLRPR